MTIWRKGAFYGGALLLLLAVVAVIAQGGSKRPRVVAYGTSLTAMYPWTPDLQQAALKCGDPIDVVNSGESMMASSWGLQHLDERVLAKKPDVVLIEFAINDAYEPYGISLAESRTNTVQLIQRIRAGLPHARIVLMSMNPVWKGFESTRSRLADYYAQYGAIAREQGVDFIDHYADWQKLLQDDPDSFKSLVGDGVHPSVAGHQSVTVRNIASLLAARPCPAIAAR